MATTPELFARVASNNRTFLVPWDALDKHYESVPSTVSHDSIGIKFVDYAGNTVIDNSIAATKLLAWEGTGIDSSGYINPYGSAYHDMIDTSGYGGADDDWIGLSTTGATVGDTVVVKTSWTGGTITAKHMASGGNLRLLGAADKVMEADVDYFVMTWDGSTWAQAAHSSVGGDGGDGDWPLSGVVIGPNGDYTTIQAAVTAGETVLVLDEGTHVVSGSGVSINRGTTVIGQGVDKSIITCSDAVVTAYIAEGAVVKDCTITNTYASCIYTVSSSYWAAYSDYVELYNVKITAPTAGDAYYTDTETRLHDCELIAAAGFGLVADSTSDVEIYGGRIEGQTTDIDITSGCDVRFYNVPKLKNGNYDYTSGLHGWYQDAAGELYGHDDPLMDMVELTSDPSTPLTNRWRLYFKSGGAYIIDDTGTVTGPLGAAGSSTGWPFSGNTITVDTTDTDADYTTLSAAIAAASAGDTIILSSESHACVNLTLPDGVHLIGQGMGATTLQSGAGIFTLKVGNNSLIMNLKVKHDWTGSPSYGPYMGTAGDTSHFINVEVDCNGNTYDMHAFIIQGSTILTNCKVDASPSTANGYCVIAKGTGTKRIEGGYFKAGGSGGSEINNDSGSTGLFMIDPVLANGGIDGYGSSSGTVGTWRDSSGGIHLIGAYTMTELGSDPSTPATGDWKLYFKSGGAYIMDDAGTVTGPLGTGGGGAPTDAEYLVLTANATLTNERIMIAGTNLTGTDAGAGGNYTIDLDNPLNLPELGSDPTTPSTGEWKLYFKADGLYIIDDTGTTVGPFVDSAGGAPETAQYVTLATDATLTNERVLVAGENITATDAGAGGNITLDLDDVLEQTEQGSDPATPATAGDWKLYFKEAGLYHRDDAGAVVGPLTASVDTQHFPQPGKCNIGATEYASFSAAVAAASSGDVILVGAGSHSCNNETIPSGVDIVGVGPSIATLTCSTNAVGMTLAGENTIENVSINQIVAESTSVCKAVTITGSGAWFYNCYLYSFNSGTQNNYALHVSSTGATPNVNWCYIAANNGGTGSSYAIYIDQASGKFRNCGIDGSDYGVYCNAASSSPQFMHCSIDTAVTPANTVSWSGGSAVVGNFITTPGGGWGDGTMIFPTDGSLQMDEWSTDPNTPKTGSWELYFKSGGLYNKDDAGTVKRFLTGSPFNTHTVDATSPDADYSTLSAAITASATGDWFEIGQGQLGPGQICKTDQVYLGKGWGDPDDKSHYVGYWSDGSKTYGLKGAAGCGFHNLMLYGEHATQNVYGVGLADSSVNNCYMWGHGTGSQDAFGVHVLSGTNYINGGIIRGSSSGGGVECGIYVESGATLYLSGLPLVMAEGYWEVWGPGSVYGAYITPAGRVYQMSGTGTKDRQVGWDHYAYNTRNITAGAVTVDQYTWIRLNPGFSDADLDTITCQYGDQGVVLFMSNSSSSYDITWKHGTGNISIPGGQDLVMTGQDTTFIVMRTSTVGSLQWKVISVAPGVGGGDDFYYWGW